MAEEQFEVEEWVEGKLYQLGARVWFQDAVWVAEHRTVVRPGLTRSWTMERNYAG